MKSLWLYIEKMNRHAETKYRIAFVISGILSAIAGLAVWLIIGAQTLSTPGWMFCFVGYPVLVTWIAVYFYACNHEFHDEMLTK